MKFEYVIGEKYKDTYRREVEIVQTFMTGEALGLVTCEDNSVFHTVFSQDGIDARGLILASKKKLEIEAGKLYMSKNGKKVFILMKLDGFDFPFLGRVEGYGFFEYNECGECGADSSQDIESEL